MTKYILFPFLIGFPFLFPIDAEAKKFKLGDTKVDLRLNVDTQVALIAIKDVKTTDANVDWAVRIKAEHPVTDAIQAGFIVKLDQDFDADTLTTMRPDGINRRLLFGYMKGKWGQLSIGEMAGQADRLSLHAPQIGTGQIRGDFTRYIGRPALLNAYDTQNAFKIDFVTTSKKPLQFGISYAPKTKSRSTGETRQTDAVEIALQSKTRLKDGWQWHNSLAHVTSRSASERRQNINSWSLGTALTKGRKWTVSAAYVDRGDSDSLRGLNQTEVNAGLRYLNRKWGLSTSVAAQSSLKETRQNYGLGGEIKLSRHARLRFDYVIYRASPRNGDQETGDIILTDLRLSY